MTDIKTKRVDTPGYSNFNAMWTRCTNPNSTAYKNYGARGIKVCERWQSFENFIADMGPKPSPDHTIGRIDHDDDYRPGNVEWQHKSLNARPSGTTEPTFHVAVRILPQDLQMLKDLDPRGKGNATSGLRYMLKGLRERETRMSVKITNKAPAPDAVEFGRVTKYEE